MKKRFLFRAFVYFLSVSFLLLVNEFPTMIAQADQNIPVGQMVSRGGVKFEVSKNSWEKVETPFPVFEGMKIKTEKGEAVLALAEKTRIEIGSDSLSYFDQRDQFNLLEGKVSFRIQPDLPLKFKVGNLWISRFYLLQASKTPPTVLSGDKESLGSIMIHSSGAVTVQSTQGPLQVRDQDGTVMASLSSRESITLPSVSTGTIPTRIAQRDVSQLEGMSDTGSGEFLGLSTWGWIALGTLIAVGATVVAVAATRSHGGGGEEAPACP